MAEKLLRGEVAKYEKLFIGYVKAHGADAIRELLSTGKTGTYKLTVLKNKKDRYQMVQLLGLIKEKDDGKQG